ncbi:MAG TPA: aldo/keto reductase, partial [Gaiellaceae bacterium]|nr:aldo/keto reductase [Gaiellaceae bacterium]
PDFFGQGENETEAEAILDAAWSAGITTYDTADAYGGGRSETWLGRWLAEHGHDAVVSTKVFHSVEGDPDDHGLAPDRIHRQIRGSLERLGRERVDMYLVHEPDPDTPLADTLHALDGLVRDGVVGSIGASNVGRAYLEEAHEICERDGLTRFEWVQNSYSLLDRGDETGVLPFCAEHGLGYTPFSPLAGGWLTGKYGRDHPHPEGSRMTMRPEPYLHLQNDAVYDGLDTLAAEAERRGLHMSTLATAWVLSHPTVTGIVCGPRRPAHLWPSVSAVDVHLSAHERDRLASLFP